MRSMLPLLLLTLIISCNRSNHDKVAALDKIAMDKFTSGWMQQEASTSTLPAVLDSIRANNMVEYQYVGIAGAESDNYKNFLNLKRLASIEQLVKLTKDTNATVACYAGWALADKVYPQLPAVFKKFLDHDRQVKIFSGCIMTEQPVSNEIYYCYWNNVSADFRATDSMLFRLDSIVLYNRHSDPLLIYKALQNRVYPSWFNKQIEYLAFEKLNNDAIAYLNKFYRSEYMPQIKNALLAYLQQTDFSTVGISEYYDTVKELLLYNDEQINGLIIQKLKTDTHWKNDEDKFMALLQKQDIYADELK